MTLCLTLICAFVSAVGMKLIEQALGQSITRRS
jgi:hypothetical protein